MHVGKWKREGGSLCVLCCGGEFDCAWRGMLRGSRKCGGVSVAMRAMVRVVDSCGCSVMRVILWLRSSATASGEYTSSETMSAAHAAHAAPVDPPRCTVDSFRFRKH